jgi:hypothetical protein
LYCCDTFRFMLQESNTAWHAKIPMRSRLEVAISTAAKNHCWQQVGNALATENAVSTEGQRAPNQMNDKASTTQARGESETSSDCNHRDRRDRRHAGLHGVWQANPQNSGYVLFGYGTCQRRRRSGSGASRRQ